MNDIVKFIANINKTGKTPEVPVSLENSTLLKIIGGLFLIVLVNGIITYIAEYNAIKNAGK